MYYKKGTLISTTCPKKDSLRNTVFRLADNRPDWLHLFNFLEFFNLSDFSRVP